METKIEYLAPQIEVVNIESENTIMSGSLTYEDRETNGTARGRRRFSWDNEI